ncbi:MAG: DUF1549 domain-containing protein [Phycisphaeraceae bacterium]
MRIRDSFILCFTLLLSSAALADTQPLHERIDALIDAGAKGAPIAGPADDAEFLRRVYLDLAGTIPSTAQARAFFADTNKDKRTTLINTLLDSGHYAPRMAEVFHIMFMERRGEHEEWATYLLESFKANKPWDQMAREIINPDPRDEAARGAAFFYSKRLEKYGENPTDYPGLTRDVGRLFLGMDLQCAQCHDHLTVRDYKQSDFQGLYTVYVNTSLHSGLPFPAVSEKVMSQKIAFSSVFNKKEKETGPAVPGLEEISIVTFEKGKELAIPADKQTKLPAVPAFSPLAELSKQLPAPENKAFARNMVNRMWFVLMGRGLVHPLDLHHVDNPPSHPELLDLLAQEFVAHKYDLKWLLRELALTRTYQRSSVLPSEAKVPVDRFTVAMEKRLSWEQLLRSTLVAAGESTNVTVKAAPEALRKGFVAAFEGEAKEAEQAVESSLKAALFLRNDATFLALLAPAKGNLAERLLQQKDVALLAEELYLSVLTRLPTNEEKLEVAAFLARHEKRREQAVSDLIWALYASAEFGVNH